MLFVPSTAIARLQFGRLASVAPLERWLDAERDQLPLWLPVMLGTGIALWFLLPSPDAWIGVMAAGLSFVFIGFSLGFLRRAGRAMLWAGLMLSVGCGLAWWRAERVAAPLLSRTIVVELRAKVRAVELQAAKDQARLLLENAKTVSVKAGDTSLPPLLRVTAELEELPAVPKPGDVIQLRARLVPPPAAAVPGGYDFRRTAWFRGIGGVGTAIGNIEIMIPSPEGNVGLRARLSAHIRAQLPESAGGIASALATGDRGGIAAEDEESMRASGLTHLLSVSGLHITAVVAAVMWISMRLLALSPRLALAWPLPVFAAGFAALAGIGYTLLTGAEVPTIRSCIAAILVLIGIAIGREAMTLRLVATGALVVLLIWPESLIGASFQLSFAAITAIVAFHENRFAQRLLSGPEDGLFMRFIRGVAALVLTGIIVEIALAPIALYHFHKQGLYGALANLVAIPLTTFVIMPLEALALLLDVIGLGGPIWWLTGKAVALLLWISREVAGIPGAVALVPSVPTGALATMLAGGFWLLLWRGRARMLGLLPLIAGATWVGSLPPPDLLVTGDGKHLALRLDDDSMALLRPKAGEFVRETLAERGGTDSDLVDLDIAPGAKCGRDMCVITLQRGGQDWRIAATRSDYRLSWGQLTAICASVDIIVSSRRLPVSCTPHWLKADAAFLRRTGGLSLSLQQAVEVETVESAKDRHPWATAQINQSAPDASFQTHPPATRPDGSRPLPAP